MNVNCPDCLFAIEIVEDASFVEIECGNCGSSFNLLGEPEAPTIEHRGTRIIGRFQLVEKVGQGEFGDVWRAKDPQLDRYVAIKVPRKGQLNPEESELFLREARAAGQLKHPNIVPVHEVGRHDETVYIVSNFIDGYTLEDRLTKGPLNVRHAAELCATVAEALHHAHEQGVIHRDLKPGNIMIDGQGQPHVMDFGLAKRDAGEITMTVDGNLIGTPAYMSPEQAEGRAHQVDRRTDVYSLGAVLFQLTTGELPFRGNARMIVNQTINDEPPSPRKFNSNIPKDLETICLKCLEKEPKKRYSAANDLAIDLTHFLDGKPIHARPVSRFERVWRWCQRKPVAAALIVAIFLLIAACVVVVWQIQESQRIRYEVNSARKEFNRVMMIAGETLSAFGDQELSDQPGLDRVRRKMLELSLKMYEDILEFNPGRNDPSIQYLAADAYVSVGFARQQLGRFDEAEQAFRNSIKILEQLRRTEFDDIKIQTTLMAAWGALGNLQLLRTQFAEADKSYQNSEMIFAQLPNGAIADLRHRYTRATMLTNMGMLRSAEQQYDRAEILFDQSIAIYRQLLDQEPRNVLFISGLSKASNSMALLFAQTDRPSKAETAYVESQRMLNEIIDAFPDNTAALSQLGTSYRNLGLTLRGQSRGDDAVEAYRKAERVFRDLVNDYPAVPHYHSELAESLHGLAQTYIDIFNDYQQAEPLLVEAANHQRKALEPDSNHVAWRSKLRNHLAILSQVQVETSQHAKAAKTIDEMMPFANQKFDYLTAASILSGCVLLAQSDEALSNEEKQATSQKYARRAVDILRGPALRGAFERDQLENAQSLKALRQYPEFKQLLEDMKD